MRTAPAPAPHDPNGAQWKDKAMGAMASWPKSHNQLKAEGYRGLSWGHCEGCGKRVLFAVTPTVRTMPLVEVNPPLFEYGGERWFESHGSDCPKASRSQ